MFAAAALATSMSERDTTDSADRNPAGATPIAGGVLGRPVFLCLLLAMVTLAVYWPVRQFEFITYDDPEYYTANRHVREGLSLDGLNWALTTGHACNWHPVTWLSHMLDASLFGPEAAGPHIVNLLLHTANSLLLFLLLLRLTGLRPKGGASPPPAGAYWCSALVAALFALHPLHVESVAWISERKDVLSTFFGLLAIGAYGRYVEKLDGQPLPTVSSPPSPIGNRQSPIGNPLVWSLAFFALSLMSKPMLVTLPFVLLLLDYWPLQRVSGAVCQVSGGDWGLEFGVWKTLLREKVPFFALAAVSSLITLAVQKTGGAMLSAEALPFGMRIANAFVSYARYLAKTFWPVNLAIPYPSPGSWPPALVAGAVVLVIGLSLLAFRMGRRRPFVLVGWFWFAGTLLPVIGLVQVGIQAMADRYSYVPLIGVFLLLAWGAGELWERRRWPNWIAGAAALALLGACAARTRNQLAVWQNAQTLFAHAIAVTPHNHRAHGNLGLYYYQHDRLDEAIAQYRQALAICPHDATALNDLGSALFRQNQVASAVECYETALRLQTNSASLHNNLGVALERIGRPDDAQRHYHEALRLEPDNARAHNNLANILVARGRLDQAVQHYVQALDADPDLTEAFNNLGWVLAGRGHYADAVQCYQSALQLKADDELIHKNLADALAKLGRKDEAIAHYTEALRLKPDYSEAREQLQALTESKPK
jgi:tetratricopeptide (TPR) repeat protein